MSNESKLRTGKWRFIPNAGDGGGIRDNSGFICFLTKPFCYPEQEERYFSEIEEYQQTKNLICAAPEMLELLEEARMRLNAFECHKEVIDRFDALIKKAKGE